jgi:hypothetical protein
MKVPHFDIQIVNINTTQKVHKAEVFNSRVNKESGGKFS